MLDKNQIHKELTIRGFQQPESAKKLLIDQWWRSLNDIDVYVESDHCNIIIDERDDYPNNYRVYSLEDLLDFFEVKLIVPIRGEE